MTQLDTIRALIQDKPQYAREICALDGVQVDLQVEHSPVAETSVIITPTITPLTYTLENESGVITFSAAPDAGTLTVSYRWTYLSDADLQSYIDGLVNYDVSDIRLAAADALDAWAIQLAVVQKKMKLLDLETDGPALAKVLQDRAKRLRDAVFSSDEQEASFDIAEQLGIHDLAAYRDKILSDLIKES